MGMEKKGQIVFDCHSHCETMWSPNVLSVICNAISLILTI